MPYKSPNELLTNLSEAELEVVRQVASMQGISVEEAASELASDAIARRIRRNTGRTPAKVYEIKGRTNG